MGDTNCPVCGYPFSITRLLFDDENGFATCLSHCNSCGEDWAQMVFYSGDHDLGRTEIDRTPLYARGMD